MLSSASSSSKGSSHAGFVGAVVRFGVSNRLFVDVVLIGSLLVLDLVFLLVLAVASAVSMMLSS